MPVPGHQIAGPDRPWKGPLGHALETRPERLRDHLRRPYRPQQHQL